jgi:hypothetical protein
MKMKKMKQADNMPVIMTSTQSQMMFMMIAIMTRCVFFCVI